VLRLPSGPLFLSNREGIEADEFYRWTSRLQRWLPPLLWSITLPAKLAGSRRRPASVPKRDPEQARFIIERLLTGARSRLGRLAPSSRDESRWTGDMSAFTYSEAQFRFKSDFVVRALTRVKPRRTLDVGCNTGYFSRLATEAGSRVVSIDRDPAVVGRLWRQAVRDGLDIQPLIADFARPTPATGWRNAECASLIKRFEEAGFEMTLLLGTLHHLMVTDRIPLDDLLDQLASITTHAVVEYVGPDDEMFQFLMRGNESLYQAVTPQWFEDCCRERFEIVDWAAVPDSNRRLYLMTSVR
jgi:SAM-dependent methyltransferase